MNVIIIMPGMYQTGRDIRARRHQKACEISDTLVLEDVYSGEYHHSDQGNSQRENNVKGSFTEKVG